MYDSSVFRSGANFVGWFNFLLNALYIGSCVKSLASVRDAIDIYEDRLDSDYINESGLNCNLQTIISTLTAINRAFIWSPLKWL